MTLYRDDQLRAVAARLNLSGYLARIVKEAVPVEPDLDILAETLSDFEPCETVEDRHYDQARHVLRVLGIGGSDDN